MDIIIVRKKRVNIRVNFRVNFENGGKENPEKEKKKLDERSGFSEWRG